VKGLGFGGCLEGCIGGRSGGVMVIG